MSPRKFIDIDESIVNTHPDLIKEWNFEKNQLKPELFTKNSQYEAYWNCVIHGTWKKQIRYRVNRDNQIILCSECKKLPKFNKPEFKKSLKYLNKNLVLEWNYKINKYGPEFYVPGSNETVWWICKKKHEWPSKINNRNQGRGCPYCKNKKAGYGNDLKTYYPEQIAKFWHPTKNKLNPDQLVYKSGKLIYIKCKNNHENKIQAYRLENYKCPQCRKTKVSDTYNFLTLNPKLEEFWAFDKNKKRPDQYMPNSEDIVWWRCAKGHLFEASVRSKHVSKAKSFFCFVCHNRIVTPENNLTTTHPELIKEWHPTKNKLKPTEVTYGSGEYITWMCEKGHEWEASLNTRTNSKSGWPICANQLFKGRTGDKKIRSESSLGGQFPELIKEWHPTKNKLKPTEVGVYSRKEIWWQCSNKHEWMKRPHERIRGKRILACPECPKEINLLDECPEILKIWDFELNEKGPEYFSPMGYAQAYFKCKKNHSYKRRVDTIRRSLSSGKNGCPECSRKIINKENSIVSTHPHLLKEWDYENNKKLPEEVAPGTRYYAYWICPVGHSYQNEVYRRTGNELRGCPHCSYSPRSQEEIILMFELMNFFEIDPDNHVIRNGNKKYNVDIIIPNERIVIEYDGSYWHKDKASFDKSKTENLNKLGWTVIRARELGGKKPLKILSKKYNLFVKPRQFKETANNVLLKIQSLGYEVDSLEKYLQRKNLINKKEALKFLDELVLRQKKFK